MTAKDIAGHLLTDWVPSLPAAVSSSFIGWPPYLLETVTMNNNDLLAVTAQTGRSERQWKGVLSWMLGVAGTRHVLHADGYRWIAPVSAFYPDANQAVDLSPWHPSFPAGIVRASRPAGSPILLRPDYLALRPSTMGQGGSLEWAVAEAKGTQRSLTALSACPREWADQVRNVVVTVNGRTLIIPRHVVVGTRINPNGARKATRRIQVRAWNNTAGVPQQPFFSVAAIEIVAAHLFGLFRGLGLLNYAHAVSFARGVRVESQTGHVPESRRHEARRLVGVAEEELESRARRDFGAGPDVVDAALPIETEFGAVKVELSRPLMTLARHICSAESSGSVVEALRDADANLNEWEFRRREISGDRSSVVFPFGIEVLLPPNFDRD
jgi:hypothetical protein